MNIKDIIKKKKNNSLLTKEEIDYVVKNFTKDLITKEDMSEFLLLIRDKGLSYKETFYLTESMVNTGNIIDLSEIQNPVVDKHSTGGVGDKTTLIVSPIVASLGVAVAKMSGRSLGNTGGTIDKLESINGYKINLTKEEFINNVNKTGICLIGQTETIAVADKKIYALRDEIGAVESVPLIASSIMSKKIASGAKSIVIDLKVGTGAFMKDVKSAKKLANTMINIGKFYKRKVVCVLTDMNSPLGYCVGNSLEVEEAIRFFDGIRDKRLEKLVTVISSYMVSLGKNISIRKSMKLVKQSLEDGTAKDKFYEWIENQGGNIHDIKNRSLTIDVLSKKEGYINEIDSLKLSKFSHELGSGRNKSDDEIDYSVGVEIKSSLYSKVNEGSILATIHYNKEIPNMEEKLRECFKIKSIKSKESDIIISVIK